MTFGPAQKAEERRRAELSATRKCTISSMSDPIVSSHALTSHNDISLGEFRAISLEVHRPSAVTAGYKRRRQGNSYTLTVARRVQLLAARLPGASDCSFPSTSSH